MLLAGPLQYELMLVDCFLPPAPGEEAAMEGSEGMLESSEPGYLKIQMDNEIFYPYREDQGYKVTPGVHQGCKVPPGVQGNTSGTPGV